MNILICDDNTEDSSRLAALIRESGLDITAALCSDGRQALEHISSGAPADACFLDIIMPRMSGVDLAKKLRSLGYSGEIVFLTASNDFARQSYQVQAFDYLLKPPDGQSVRDILQKIEHKLAAADNSGVQVKVQGLPRFIRFRDISHIEASNHSVFIRLRDIGQARVYTTFEEIAAQLSGDRRFMQCHGSFIVNMSAIDAIVEGGLVMQNGAKVPVSRRFSTVREDIMKWMFRKAADYGL